VDKALLSVGLDVGTTSTQLIFSELAIENRAGSFSVPEMAITDRKIIYKSPVHFTPLLDEARVDGAALRRLISREYAAAGIARASVDTGAIIITGETSRKENAATVLSELSGFAGDFVVATAGPDLESILAAKGAGAVARSRDTGETLLHMDIGGGTANLALVQSGEITATGCLNVGGRLIKFDQNHIITYVSPVLRGLCSLSPGDTATPEALKPLAEILVQALEMAAGLCAITPLLARLTTPGTAMEPPSGPVTLSFSGGVADCIDTVHPWDAFGDLGPILGRAIRRSRLCAGKYRLGQETIRATVIGAGCHSAQLSGSTVFLRNVALPLKNLPVICPPRGSHPEDFLRRELARQEGPAVIALPAPPTGGYAGIRALAAQLAAAIPTGPVLICLEQDTAKALGQCLALELPPERPILCIDRVRLTGESYLDIGSPTGPALPVVVKTLILNR
jgi:ethanolamine utilization protein EutA